MRLQAMVPLEGHRKGIEEKVQDAQNECDPEGQQLSHQLRGHDDCKARMPVSISPPKW